MGQSHSSKSYTIQNAFANVNETYTDDTAQCCLYKVKRPPPIKEPDWKDHMIQQLTQLQLEEWPTVLIKTLHSYQDNLADTNYRIKVVESRLLQPRSDTTLHDEQVGVFDMRRDSTSQLHLSRRTSNPFGINNSKVGSRKEERDVNASIKQLLETSDILDEKLCPSAYKEVIESYKADQRNKTTLNIPNLSRLSNDQSSINPKPVEVNVSNGKSLSSNHFQSYQNNTVVSQLGPIYRIQSHNTADLNADRTEGCLLYYKQITGIIESHLKQETNIFRQLIRSFEDYFMKMYEDKAGQFKDSIFLEMKFTGVVQKATRDLQQFIRILCDGINLFYDLQNLHRGRLSTGASIFNYDNISNFITTLICNEKIYNIIFQLYEIENAPIENTYRTRQDYIQRLRPQDYGVPDEYCLNERTLECFRYKGAIPAEQRDILGLDSDQNKGNNLICLDRQDPWEINKLIELQQSPYEKAIERFRGLARQRSPVHKSKVIIKTIEMIGASIDEFYEEMGIKSERNLSGDHTLSLFCYIVSKSGVRSILSHCRIINELSSPNVMSSICGYYAVTLEAAIQYICRMPVKNNLLLIEEQNEHSVEQSVE